MSTLRDAWNRLKALLLLALSGKARAASATADAKKTAALIEQFNRQFVPIFAQIEKHYQAKAQLEAALKKSVDGGLKLSQDLKKQILLANKDGFTQGQVREDLEGRLSEIISLLTELKSNGFQVQWD